MAETRDDEAATHATVQRLCSALDELKQELQRVTDDILTRARGARKRQHDRERYRLKPRAAVAPKA